MCRLGRQKGANMETRRDFDERAIIMEQDRLARKMKKKKYRKRKIIAACIVAVLAVGAIWYFVWGRNMFNQETATTVSIKAASGQEIIYARLDSVRGNEITYTIAAQQEESESSGASGDVETSGRPEMSGDVASGGRPEMSGDAVSGGRPEMSGDVASGERPEMSGDVASGGRPEMSGDAASGGRLEMSGDAASGGRPEMSGDAASGERPDMSAGYGSGDQPESDSNTYVQMPSTVEGSAEQSTGSGDNSGGGVVSGEGMPNMTEMTGQEGMPDMSQIRGGMFGRQSTDLSTFTYNSIVYELTQDTGTGMIPVGTTVTTLLGTETTFSRLKTGDYVAIVATIEDGEQVIMAVYIVG